MSTKPIIDVDQLSKCYRLGTIGATTLRDSLARGIQRLKGPKSGLSRNADLFWALRDISFAVEPGQVLGIVGRNGAGKSTLLKVLSRITEPTSGQARLRGRVASLLEVGTGFHPELTGRENTYLNGAILGMAKGEIRRKLDMISSFAGIEDFMDTPVKRYSSGMRVRLGFAVAAHLEPEILIVDEVLAVGDAAFQQKCLGKIDEVAHSGRTVLFVSHNMGSIQSLCSRVIVLDDGLIAFDGDPTEGIERYYRCFATDSTTGVYQRTKTLEPTQSAAILSASLQGTDGKPSTDLLSGQPLVFEVEIQANTPSSSTEMGIGIFNNRGVRITTLHTHCNLSLDLSDQAGRFILRCETIELALAAGHYHVRMQLIHDNQVADTLPVAFSFQIIKSDYFKNGGKSTSGVVLTPQRWSVQSIEASSEHHAEDEVYGTPTTIANYG